MAKGRVTAARQRQDSSYASERARDSSRGPGRGGLGQREGASVDAS